MIPAGTLEAFGLYLARSVALVTSAPIIGQTTRFNGYKVALVVSLAGLSYGAVGEPLPEADGWAYGVMALRECLIGFFLSFLLHLAMTVVRVAGQLIGGEMGFMIAGQIDPTTGLSTPLITSFYETLFTLGFLALNGHFLLIRALASSYERVPVGGVSFNGGLGLVLAQNFGQLFEAGFVFAAPIMTLLFVVSLLIGFLARAVPQVHVLELGFALRILIALIVMYGFAPLLEPAFEKVVHGFGSALEGSLEALGG